MATYIVQSNNVIKMNRGDFFKFPIVLSNREFPFNETNWKLDENDVVYFALMEPKQHFEDAFLKKELTYKDADSEGNLYVKLLPEDTIDLMPGTYYYQIKALYTVAGDEDIHVDTVVQKTKFLILD